MYKALKSFGGKISMKKGEVKDINDEDIANDLLNAGYIEKIKEETKEIKTKIINEVKKIDKEIKEDTKKVRKTKKK